MDQLKLEKQREEEQQQQRDYFSFLSILIFVPVHSTQPTISLFSTTIFSDPR
jgi:hypothetical protein